jgi:hypothetical protein
MAQAIEHLLCKCKALSSNLSSGGWGRNCLKKIKTKKRVSVAVRIAISRTLTTNVARLWGKRSPHTLLVGNVS